MGLQIELDNPNRSYFAGQYVTGKVIVQNTKPDRIKEITILLEGKGRVRWKEEKTRNIFKPKTLKETFQPQIHESFIQLVTYSAEEHLVLYKSILLEEGTYPEGTYVYPFAFNLPQNLPSSFNSHVGQVSYLLRGEIRRSHFLKYNDKQIVPFTVNGIFDLNLHPVARLPQECRKSKGSNFPACRKGDLGFVLSLPERCGFVPGEILNFRAEITNGSNKRVTEMKASLSQLATFTARGGKTKSVTKILSHAEGPEVGKGEYETWCGKLSVPPVPPTKLGGNCGVIDVQYLVYFEMKISGMASTPLSGRPTRWARAK